jgi:hypothetical protein
MTFLPKGARLTIDDTAGVPILIAHPNEPSGTGLILFQRADALPAVWAGPMPAAGLDPGDAEALLAAVRPCALLPQHAEGWFGRPGLSGHRLGASTTAPARGSRPPTRPPACGW